MDNKCNLNEAIYPERFNPMPYKVFSVESVTDFQNT